MRTCGKSETNAQQRSYDISMAFTWTRSIHLTHQLRHSLCWCKWSKQVSLSFSQHKWIALHKENFQPSTSADISTEPFARGPATPGMTPNNQDINIPVTFNDIASLIVGVSPVTIGQQTSPLGANQTQQTGNPALLPPEAQQRLENGEQHGTYLTRQERCSFNLSVTNIIIDPAGNTMRKMSHFMDGPHWMITRSGDLFYFSKWDEKKQKMFISERIHLWWWYR